jgi:carbon monoxide dehydrogenase subunit G
MVKIEQKGCFEIDNNINTVYEYLTDPEKVASAFPILENINIIDRDNFNVKIKLKIGIIHGSADLKLRFAEKKHPFYAKIIGNGIGLKSTMNLELSFELKESEPTKTLVNWSFVADVTGMAASLGAHVLKSSSESIVNQVINNLKNILSKKI